MPEKWIISRQRVPCGDRDILKRIGYMYRELGHHEDCRACAPSAQDGSFWYYSTGYYLRYLPDYQRKESNPIPP
mgnify:FL=1